MINLTSNESFTAKLINHLDKFLGKSYGLLVDSDKITVSDFDHSLTNIGNITDSIDSVCRELIGREFIYSYTRINGAITFYNFNEI